MASSSTSASRPRPARPSTSTRSAASASQPCPTGSTSTSTLAVERGSPGSRSRSSGRTRSAGSCPIVSLDGVLGAAYTPTDGYVDPSGVTQALARGARDLGAEIQRRAPVRALRPTPSGEWEVVTDQGTVTAEIVVDAGGIWGREIGELAGVELPIVPMEHQYLVTDAIQALAAPHRELPVIRDVEASFYVREEARRAHRGSVRGPSETVVRARDPGRLRSAAARAGSAPDRADRLAGAVADPGSRRCRAQAGRLRADQLHARRQCPHGLGSGTAQLLRPRRLQLRDRPGGRRWPLRRRVDRRRSAER